MAKTPLFLCIAALGLALLASGCANPTVAYHRQFEYLVREGREAIVLRELDVAYEHLSDAAELAQFAEANDLEFVDVLTLLSEVARETGRADEAKQRMKTAGRVLARYSLKEGSGGWTFPRVAGAYALERARLAESRGDLNASENAITEFFGVRGSKAAGREAAEAHRLRGELLLGRDLGGRAREAFERALEAARPLEAESDARLRGAIFLRVAETEVERGRISAARELVDATRPEGVGLPALRPDLLLVLARIDVAESNFDRARVRLEEALELLAEDRDPDTPTLARAAFIARIVFDAKAEAAALEATLDRSAARVTETSPLGAVLLGRALVDAGRDWIATGDRARGVKALDRGRRMIESAVRGRAHVALLTADFEIAMALESLGRPDVASKRCARLQEMSKGAVLSVREDAEATTWMIACGRIDARQGEIARARKAFMDALKRTQATGHATSQFELLIRLAALARVEERDSAEAKLFERALPMLTPEYAKRLPGLLGDAYGAQGSTAPSSAAARLAHTAVRSQGYQSWGSQLQQIATALDTPSPAASAPPVPASRR